MKIPKVPTKDLVAIAAMAGLLTGCATPAPKHESPAAGTNARAEKGSCGTKGNCSSKSECRAKENCGAKKS